MSLKRPAVFACLLAACIAVGAHAPDDGQAHTHAGVPTSSNERLNDPDWLDAFLRHPAEPERLARLQRGLRQAESVVIGRVVDRQQRDDGRLHTATLTVAYTLLGSPSETTLPLVAMRGALSGIAFGGDGIQLTLLEPAPDHSYLRAQLGDGRRWQITQAPLSLRAVDDGAAGRLGHWLRALADDKPRSASELLRLLADGYPALAGPLLADLAAVPAPEALDESDRREIARIMGESLPGKAGLAEQLAAWELEAALPLMQQATADSPAVAARLWRARARLGAPPRPQDAEVWHDSHDPAERAASAWILASTGDQSKVLALATRLEQEPDAAVRRAILEALPELEDPAAERALLAVAFDDALPQQRHAAARMLIRRHPQAADDWLIERVRASETRAVRRHAARLLVSRRGTEDDTVRRLAEAEQDAELARILREGVVRVERLHHHGPGDSGHAH